MPDTSPATAPATNQLPPRTTTSTRWPRKWATLGGRSTPASAMITTTQIDDPDLTTTTFESNGSSKKTSNGSHSHANGHHHHHSSLFRKSSTLSRTNNNPTTTIDGIETPSLKKSRSLMNVLRAKLNSPAVLRRFRTKSRESIKQTVTEISTNEHPIDEENVPTSLEITKKKSSSLPKSIRPPVVIVPENQDEQPIARKSRKRDPSPMRRFAHRLAQLTKSSSTSNEVHENGVDQKKHPRRSMSPSKSATLDSRSSPSPIPIHNKDEVDHINACYDEIRAKYFDTNTKRNPSATIDLLSHHPCAPPSTLSPTQRLQDILSTTTVSSSIDYYDRPILIDDGNIVDRSLSTISMNGSLRSNDYMNNYSQRLTSPLPDDPLLIARKQSNIKLNCMLSGYGFTTPFGQSNLNTGQHELFKFHHYYDVGKRRFDLNLTTNHQNRMFASMRTRPISRSIDSFRPTIPTTENESEPIVLPSDELIIREDGDPPSEQQQQYASKIHVTPAVPVKVTTFVASSSTLPSEEQDEEFERNFLRAVDRALGVVVNKDQDSLYDVPLKIEENKMNLIEITERALSSFNNSEFLIDDQPKENEHMEKSINGTESPSVELFDRTGEMFDNETINWQSSAVYENGVVNREMPVDNEEVWSVVDELTRKTQELLYDEPKNGREFLAKLDDEEKVIKSKADAYSKLVQSDDSRLTEDVRTDIMAVVGEVNLLLKGKLKQFRGLCQANVAKSKTAAGEPTPLDSDLEGFWDITYPLIDKVKAKFVKLDGRKAKQWAPIEDEYDPDDVNNRPRVIDDRLKQLQPQQQLKSKVPVAKNKPGPLSTANDDLKKMIQERRKAAASTASNQNHDIEIFVAHK